MSPGLPILPERFFPFFFPSSPRRNLAAHSPPSRFLLYEWMYMTCGPDSVHSWSWWNVWIRALSRPWIAATWLVIKRSSAIVWMCMVEVRMLSSVNTGFIREGSCNKATKSVDFLFFPSEELFSLCEAVSIQANPTQRRQINLYKSLSYCYTSRWAAGTERADSRYSVGGRCPPREVKRVWFTSWSAD